MKRRAFVTVARVVADTFRVASFGAWFAVLAVLLAPRPAAAQAPDRSRPPAMLPAPATPAGLTQGDAPTALPAVVTPAVVTPAVAVAAPSAPAASAAGEATVQANLTVEGAGLEVDGDFTAAKDGRATVKVKPGKHSVVVRAATLLDAS